MERILRCFTIHGKWHYGCKKNNKDVMISLKYDDTKKVYHIDDLFLSQEQAEDLHEKLGKVLKRNAEKG